MSEEETTEKEAKEIKYLKEISTIGNCTDSLVEMEIMAYRWTFQDINDLRNFRPRAMDNTNPKQVEMTSTCGGWSLSFFITEQNAVNRLNYICKDKAFLYKKLGTHVAEGLIEKTDGICGAPDNNGHFEHFEYKDTNFTTKFVIKTQVNSA